MGSNPEQENDYFVILDALDKGVVPDEIAAKELCDLGILEPGPNGWVMTLSARLKLQNLRSVRRESASINLFTGDVSDWTS